MPLTIEEANAAQQRADALATELNKVIREATARGMRFELDIHTTQAISAARPTPVLDVIAFVDPRNLEKRDA